jgi:radical SAM protein with 4Fe4S-binding SPASM domain
MKFCKRPYEHMYIMPNGDARCCSWIQRPYPLGNIIDNSLEEVWNSEQAKAIRDSVADGSYRYCSKVSCPHFANDSLPDITQEAFEKETASLKSPVEFNLAYDMVCNHACPTCRDEIFVPNDAYKQKVAKIEKELEPYLKKANLIMASGNGDLFASQSMLSMLSKIHPDNKNCVIKLETNGALVTKRWKELEHFEPYQIKIVVTPNSYERETYKYLSGGLDNVDKTLEGIAFLSRLRQENKIAELSITMVVQDTNFREIPSFIRKNLEDFNVDKIQLRPVMQWFKISKEAYLQKNVLNASHPEHEEFIEIMRDPLCSHEKVYHWSGKV